MAKIVIEVSGGVVQEVYSDDSTLEVVLVDWDNIQEGDDAVDFMGIKPLESLPQEIKDIL